MLKILTVIYFVIILCSSNLSFANDGYEIIVKVNNKIISNHDIEKEKSYLSALNPKVLDIPENEFKDIAKKSLIREIIKEKELSKYFDMDYRSPELIQIAKILYTQLNINSEEEFKMYLENYNLDINDVFRKLSVESNWNALIYQKYNKQIVIDKEKIKKKLELVASNNKEEKFFLLSEILFSAKNKEEFDDNYKKINETINNTGFESAASIYSLSDTAKFAGDIGWVSKNDISENIYKQISTLEINEFTKPFKIATGFLIISVRDIKIEEKKNNLEEQYNKVVSKETNRQLNQYSTIYFKKIEKQSFINEN
tara:strand:+ start:1367 stop:2302 length:936 start_codon:yes stop_codon:yes gene_type:complete